MKIDEVLSNNVKSFNVQLIFDDITTEQEQYDEIAALQERISEMIDDLQTSNSTGIININFS